MLLVEVFLKLGELVQVPVFFPKSITRISKLSSTTSTVATKARRTTAIAAVETRPDSQSQIINSSDINVEVFKTI